MGMLIPYGDLYRVDSIVNTLHGIAKTFNGNSFFDLNDVMRKGVSHPCPTIVLCAGDAGCFAMPVSLVGCEPQRETPTATDIPAVAACPAPSERVPAASSTLELHRVLDAKLAPLSKFVGSRVELHSLKRTELNGRRGYILPLLPQIDRVPVHIGDHVRAILLGQAPEHLRASSRRPSAARRREQLG